MLFYNEGITPAQWSHLQPALKKHKHMNCGAIATRNQEDHFFRMNDASPNVNSLVETLTRRIVIIDGAMGTMIQAHKLEEADYRGKEFARHGRDLRQCNDVLNITQPAIIEEIHRQYLDAGADVIETNTFNSTAISMADYKLEDHIYDLNRAGAQVARRAVETFTQQNPARTC